MSYPRFQASRAFKKARRTSGDITLNSTSWANVDTGLDIVLAAQVGDEIEATVSFLLGNEAVDAYFDVATIVSAAPVNSFGNAGAVTASPPKYGVSGWRCEGNRYMPVGSSFCYTVVSGDLSSGFVTLRLRYATSAATNRTLYAGANYAAQWQAKNLGPADPN